MKKKLTNTRVINSIGIGILAMVTAGTPVLAAINDAVNDNSTADTSVSDIPAEPVEQAAPSQNEQILQTLAETQGVIQEMVQAPGIGPANTEETGGPAEETGAPAETAPSEGAAGTEDITTDITTAAPSDAEGPVDNTQTPSDTEGPSDDSQLAEGEGTQDEGTGEQPPAEGEGTENPPVDEGNGDVSQGTGDETPESTAPTVEDYLKETEDSLGEIIDDIQELEQKNDEAKDAVKDYKEAVANPNNFIGSIVDQTADANSATADAADSAAKEEAAARDQAQIAVDAQNTGYASKEEAEAAQQQAQTAADAAEEAYRSAQAAVEEAENNTAIAGENVEALKRLRDEAALALEEMNAKVGAAQEMLRTILADYGFDIDNITPGSFDKNQLEGEAKKAYESAEKALEQAIAEQAAAQRNYDAAAGELEPAVADFKAMEDRLSALTGELESAKTAADDSMEKLDQAELDAVIADYNQTADETEKIKLDLTQAQEALAQAQDALAKAEEVKKRADDVVKNAEKAVEEANKKEESKIGEAEKAAEDALNAVENDAANAQQVFEYAQAAKEEAEKAAAEVSRAATSLQSVKSKAEEAAAELREKQNELNDAEKVCKDAKKDYEEADALLSDLQKEVLEKEEDIVKNAQKKAGSGAATEVQEFAKALLRFKLHLESEDVNADIPMVVKVDKAPKYIIQVTDSNGKSTDYWYKNENGNLIICKGTDSFYSESDFNSISDTKKAAEDKKEEWHSAEEAFEEAKDAVSLAEEELKKANDQAAVVDALEKVAAALSAVHEKADALVKAEENYQQEYTQNKDSISAKLSNFISKGTDLKEANANLEHVNEAKERVDETIAALTKLTAQEKVNQSEYNSLVNAYNTAKADYDAALEALDKCMASRDRAETEKDRARAAANGVFRYITENNTGTVTPIQPGTLNPIYGTIIDSITSPIIGNTGVSAPSGTTGTGYAGYTYTIGGQPVYAVGETAADEEEPAGEELVSVEEAAVPLAEVGENNKSRTTNTNNTRKVSDEKIPLANVETENNKISWWWILVIALLGATGTELYIRHQKKEEQERKAKRGKQDLAEI